MSGILEEIVESKREEIEHRKDNTPLGDLKQQVKKQPGRFSDAFSDDELSLMAEIKPEAPSAGSITDLSPGKIARVYQQEDVSAVSCLTDKAFFGQGLETLKQIKTVLRKPILRKDFIIDPYQVYETGVAGADALLLIASVLDGDTLAELYELTSELGMDALVEVHSRDEIEGLPIQPDIVGINNRTLDGDFSTDLSVTERLAPEIPDNVILISESGIKDSKDVERLRNVPGLDGILVGTSILNNADSPETIRARVRSLIGSD